MIQESTLIEAILGFRAQIDFLWQFFVTVHIAIFALLFIYDEAVESLNVVARIFAIAGVAAFEWINGKALANTYLLLDATLDQYRALYGQVDRFQPDFFRHFVNMSFADRPAIQARMASLTKDDDVRVRWQEGGRPVERNEVVRVYPGDRRTLDFRAPSAGPSAP